MLKFNNRSISLKALYRMFVACYMMRGVQIDGLHKAHNYPRMQLAYMLTIEHWRTTSHVTWDILRHLYMFNEEYGEIYFSLLSRCVLGDYHKSSFEHMDGQYRLLPIYQQVKADIIDDTSNSNTSITWRHNIKPNSAEVIMTSVFFQRVINTILTNKHKSYQYKKAYGILDTCRPILITNPIPIVFNINMVDELDDVFCDIQKTICAKWMAGRSDIWPEVIIGEDENDVSDDSDDDIDESNDENESKSQIVWGADWDKCVVGHYAVVRKNFHANKTGISVYKITRKLTTGINIPNDRMVFEGTEFVCDIVNYSSDCVRRGTWHYHATMSKSYTEMNWSVLGYFEKLTENRKRLPNDTILSILEQNDIDPIFGSD